ncbi:hypothetical protein EV2_003749 [Malus domestica]
MAMAWRLPTLHHRDSETPSFQASLSWCRTLAPDHLLPSSSPSTSTATHSAGAGAVNLARGTPVRPSSILVVGATETLGRQIAQQAVDEGYVRCLVRPRPTPADILRDWHAIVVNYCSAYIRREISIGNRCPHKNCMHDVAPAPLTFIGSRNEKVSGKLVTFAGPRAWTTQEVITLCERFAGQEANITRVPVSVLRVTRQLTRLFECTNDVADRLAFLEVSS